MSKKNIRQSDCVTIGMSYGPFFSLFNNWIIIYDDTIHSLMCLVYTAGSCEINLYHKSKADRQHIVFLCFSSLSLSLSLWSYQITKQNSTVLDSCAKRTSNHSMILRKRQQKNTTTTNCKACANWSYRQNNCHDVSENKSKITNAIQTATAGFDEFSARASAPAFPLFVCRSYF